MRCFIALQRYIMQQIVEESRKFQIFFNTNNCNIGQHRICMASLLEKYFVWGKEEDIESAST